MRNQQAKSRKLQAVNRRSAKPVEGPGSPLRLKTPAPPPGPPTQRGRVPSVKEARSAKIHSKSEKALLNKGKAKQVKKAASLWIADELGFMSMDLRTHSDQDAPPGDAEGDKSVRALEARRRYRRDHPEGS